MRYANTYVCPGDLRGRDQHEPLTWVDDDCDSMHNDRCPDCNAEIEPGSSEEIDETSPLCEAIYAVLRSRDAWFVWLAYGAAASLRVRLVAIDDLVAHRVALAEGAR